MFAVEVQPGPSLTATGRPFDHHAGEACRVAEAEMHARIAGARIAAVGVGARPAHGAIREFQRHAGALRVPAGCGSDQQQAGPGALSVPQVMPVVRGRRDPVKVVFDLGDRDVSKDKVIARIDARRKKLARELRGAREARDMGRATRLLRELESLRLERLERLRRLAPPQVVSIAPKARAASPAGGSAPAAEEKPVLPIPTRPDDGK